MPSEKATALVLRSTDWSETSRIATLWTREFGKVRVLAKGGRRLKSNFESALDLLTLCSIVLIRKSSGGLDLLTEARVVQRFPRLRSDLSALYAAYYIAELLSDWTEEYDPHPNLFEEALATLQYLGAGPQEPARVLLIGPRLARFELVLLRELGYSPTLEICAACANPLARTSDVDRRGEGKATPQLAFSAAAGGVLCLECARQSADNRGIRRDRRPLSAETWEALRVLSDAGDAWQRAWSPAVRAELRQLLGQYISYLMGRQPRLLPYLGS